MVAQATRQPVLVLPRRFPGKGDKAGSRGDMTGSIGKVVAVDPMERVVTLEMDNIIGQLLPRSNCNFLMTTLKYILQGAHVKVAEGIYAGETDGIVMVNEAENVSWS